MATMVMQIIMHQLVPTGMNRRATLPVIRGERSISICIFIAGVYVGGSNGHSVRFRSANLTFESIDSPPCQQFSTFARGKNEYGFIERLSCLFFGFSVALFEVKTASHTQVASI